MQIPIISGIYVDANPDFRTTYPHNLVPVPKGQGISSGFLRPADGIETFATAVGADRGGMRWLDKCYRVQGTDLIRVNGDGTTTVIGDVGAGGRVTFDYSFDYLAVASGGKLFLYDGSSLTEVTDPDAGTVNSLVWIDGYFVFTDGEFLVVTELGNPFSVNPLKYGSSEIDPDPVNSVLELRNEVYAVNRYSIEVFDNIGGTAFPFQRIEGAQIQKGSVGTHAAVVFDKKVAFVGGGRNETTGVYIAINGQDAKISTLEIDTILKGYSSTDIADTFVEARKDGTHEWLYIHLTDKTLVYDASASEVMQTPVWFTLSGGIATKTRYPAQGFVWCYDKWITGDTVTGEIGTTVRDKSTHFGAEVRWDFNVGIIYNEGRGAIVNELELVCLTGSVDLGKSPVVTTEYTLDGVTWSTPLSVSAGEYGDRSARVAWRRLGKMYDWRSQRFSGSSDAHISIVRLEAQIEGLAR